MKQLTAKEKRTIVLFLVVIVFAAFGESIIEFVLNALKPVK